MKSQAHDTTQLTEYFELLKKEVDALQVAVMREQIPWYKQMPIIVSVIALLFSFSTTFVSYKKSEIEEIKNSRTELRQLLQRLSELPIENVQYGAMFAQDPTRLGIIAGILTQENSILTQQAAEIARKLPPGYISAAEYYALGAGLVNSFDLEPALEFYSNAAKMSDNLNIAGSSLRGSANVLFAQKMFQEGRDKFREAFELSDSLASKTDFEKTYNRLLTQLNWAVAEDGSGHKAEASKLLDEAEATLTSNAPYAKGLRTNYEVQIHIMRSNLKAGLPLRMPTKLTP